MRSMAFDVRVTPTIPGTKWTLENAIELIRLLQPTAHAHGYHLALAGGILNFGYSDKDVDIVALPNFNAEQQWDEFQDDAEEILASPLVPLKPSKETYPLPFNVYVGQHKHGRVEVIRHERT